MNSCKYILKIFVFAVFCVSIGAAQPPETSAMKKPQRRDVMSVGLIKSYPENLLPRACSNFYFVSPQKINSPGSAEYIFLAHSDANGWMNIDGRDTLLKYLKTRIANPNTAKTRWRYYYRAGRTGIMVSIINNPGYTDDDYPYAMIITLKRGRVVRRVKAIGTANCSTTPYMV